MYARITNYQCDPARLDDVNARLPDIKSQITRLDGAVSIYTVWGDDGAGVTVSIWNDKTAADASQPMVRDIWAGLADLMQGPPQAQEYANVEKLSA